MRANKVQAPSEDDLGVVVQGRDVIAVSQLANLQPAVRERPAEHFHAGWPDYMIDGAPVDQHGLGQIAEMLVKSTSAICAAIGAQPIPLADLPILTTLQLVMVSGIMYISGRERSMRAATEFVGALGANVGLGMILREGTRAALKFFPGWGNVVCGMVAGAGTFAIGRAASVYFIEGATLRDARRTFLQSKKKRLPLSGQKTKALHDMDAKR